ncbi:MAG TPA: flavin reductase family protein [Mycobacteriales bacterium]|nr:flavin reductase family protein [Mycobacteriales bacterium]
MFEQAKADEFGRFGLDPALVAGGVYALLNSVVVPRAIAWVSTTSVDGVDNLAPHSFFTISSVDPPVVQFTSVGTKDSMRNAVATGEFVVSVCTEALVEQVNISAVPFPGDISEFDHAGVTREPSVRVRPPRVAESPVSLECRVVGTHDFGGDSTVVFGQVVWVSLRADVVVDDRVSVDRLRPVSRLGGAAYAPVREVFVLPRITIEEWHARAGEESA